MGDLRQQHPSRVREVPAGSSSGVSPGVSPGVSISTVSPCKVDIRCCVKKTQVMRVLKCVKGRQDKLRSNQESHYPFGFTVSCYTKPAKTVTFFASTMDLKMSQASADIGRRAESYCPEALHACGSGQSRAQPRHISVLRITLSTPQKQTRAGLIRTSYHALSIFYP